MAAEDEEFASEARQAFAKLEEGHQPSLQDWKICRHDCYIHRLSQKLESSVLPLPVFREMSVESLEVAYSRLGIQFDHFDGESMYGGRASDKVIIIFHSIKGEVKVVTIIHYWL